MTLTKRNKRTNLADANLDKRVNLVKTMVIPQLLHC
jgi:hypothetical protein